MSRPKSRYATFATQIAFSWDTIIQNLIWFLQKINLIFSFFFYGFVNSWISNYAQYFVNLYVTIYFFWHSNCITQQRIIQIPIWFKQIKFVVRYVFWWFSWRLISKYAQFVVKTNIMICYFWPSSCLLFSTNHSNCDIIFGKNSASLEIHFWMTSWQLNYIIKRNILCTRMLRYASFDIQIVFSLIPISIWFPQEIKLIVVYIFYGWADGLSQNTRFNVKTNITTCYLWHSNCIFLIIIIQIPIWYSH